MGVALQSKRMQEALQESEAKYRLLFESANDAIFIHDEEARMLAVNLLTIERFGYTDAELMSMTVSQLDSNDEAEHVLERIALIREQGQLTFETVQQRKDGSLVPSEVSSRLITWAGRPAILSICRDITERKQAEERLRLTQLSVDSAVDLVAWIGEDGRLFYVNDAFCSRHGYSREELLDMAIYDLDPNLSAETWPDQWLRDKEQGPTTIEVAHRTKSGEIFPTEVVAHFVEHDGKEYNVGFAHDISERKRAEDALRASEDRYETLVNLSPDAITASVGGKYVFANPAAARLFGAGSPEELVGRVALDLVQPDDRALVTERIEQALDGVISPPRELKLLRLDGSPVEVEAMAAGIQFEGTAAIQTVLRDITERKQAEQLLQFTQFSVDHAADAIYWTDPDSHLILVSDSACRLFGYPREELLAMDVFDLDLAVSAEMWSESWERMKKEGAFTFETAIRANSGDTIPVELTVNYLQYAGREYNCVFARDMTERKQAEERQAGLEAQLRQAQKMEAVGRLAGGVAHDFNNMLGVIIGHAEMALEEVDPSRPLYADLSEIKKAAERSADLTRQLLAFARKQTITPRVLDLNETVAGMLTMLRATDRRGYRAPWQPGADLWPVKMDPSQIDQILANLCVNARDAINGVGTMTIETGNSTFDARLLRRSTPAPSRRLRAPHRQRQRLRHGHGDAGSSLRTVLHHQGGGPGHRPGPGHRLRHRQTERRLHQASPASRMWGPPSRSTCPGTWGRPSELGRGLWRGPPSGARRPSCSWKTSRPSSK